MLVLGRAKSMFAKRKICVTVPLPEACSLGVEMGPPAALTEDLPRVARLVAGKVANGGSMRGTQERP